MIARKYWYFVGINLLFLSLSTLAFDNPKVFSINDDLDLFSPHQKGETRKLASETLSLVKKSKQSETISTLAEVTSPVIVPPRVNRIIQAEKPNAPLLLERVDELGKKVPLQTVDVSQLNWTRPEIKRSLQTATAPSQRNMRSRSLDRPSVRTSPQIDYRPTATAQPSPSYIGQQPTISLHLAKVPIAVALKALAHMIKKDLVLPQPIPGSITIFVQNQPWSKVLDLILKSSPYTWNLDKTILVVHKEGPAAPEKRNLQHREFFLNYLTAKQAAKLVRPFLSKNGQVSPHANRNILIVADTSEVLETIARIVEAGDLPRQTVRIKTLWAELSPEAANSLGIRQSHGHFTLGQSYNALRTKLRALESSGQVTVLSDPQIITLNHRESKLTQTDLYTKYRATLVHSISTSFKPQVINNQWIELTINLTHSNPSHRNDTPEHTQTTHTTLLVKPEDTIAIGGLSPMHTGKSQGERVLIAFISADLL